MLEKMWEEGNERRDDDSQVSAVTTGLVDGGVILGVRENSLSGREMMVPFRSWV